MGLRDCSIDTLGTEREENTLSSETKKLELPGKSNADFWQQNLDNFQTARKQSKTGVRLINRLV